MTTISRTLAAGDVVLEFSGEFDARGAEELATAVTLHVGSGQVVIDLSRARPIQDKALGMLVDGLSGSHLVRGVGPHHRRLLQCLGARVEDVFTAEV